MPDSGTDFHAGMPVLSLGSDLKQATSALVLLHRRGAAADDMAGLAQAFDLPKDMVVLLPQARGHTWYPQRFIAPLSWNEPYLSSALRQVDELVSMLEDHGVRAENVILGGFSQGACLAAEYLVRHPRQWGGLLVFSGGYIGPLDAPRDPEGSLHGTPIFLGCSDIDPHIPLQRVNETSALLTAMGAEVNTCIYPGMGHMINQDEIEQAQTIISRLPPL